MFFGEDGGMDVDAEREMIVDQILAGGTKVHWVEVLEVVLELRGLLQRERSAFGVLTRTQNIVPDLIGHVFRSDAKTTGPSPEHVVVKQVRDSVVRHVDSRVRERFDQKFRVPRKLGPKSVRSSTRPLVQPVQNSLEPVSSLGKISVHLRQEPDMKSARPLHVGMIVCNLLLRDGFPLVFSVVKVPLIDQGSHANIGASRNDFTLGFSVREGETGFDHLLADLWFGVFYRFALEIACTHDTVVEPLLVCQVFGFGKLLDVFLRLNLELRAESLGRHRAVLGGSQNRNRVDRSPFWLDFVMLGFFAEIHIGSVIIRRVGWDRSDYTSTLKRIQSRSSFHINEERFTFVAKTPSIGST